MLWGEIGLLLLMALLITCGPLVVNLSTLQILVAVFRTQGWDNGPMLPSGCKLVQHFQWVF